MRHDLEGSVEQGEGVTRRNILLSTSQYRPWFSGKLLREKTALAKPVLPLAFLSVILAYFTPTLRREDLTTSESLVR